MNPSRAFSAPELESIASQMAATLRHRGPDDEGVWAEPQVGLALGHRRLAIQDLSGEGHQPMVSPDGRYVLSFNGEIYNFPELRSHLEQRGHSFRGHSDTEIMLAAFMECGLEPALESFIGMFAFALWDRQHRQLHLVRDRAGEKPLYYGWSGGTFMFGSELKALRAHPSWESELEPEALNLFLRHNYIPAPHSIYRNIFKLPPGNRLTLNANELDERRTPEPKAYWSLRDAAERGLANPFCGHAQEATQHLTELLRQSVALQMVADVPVGAFLSGGVDSSTVVALMQSQSRRPVKTFSIGFASEAYDEAPFAKAIAGHLGTQHTELYVHPGTLQEVIPRLATIYDEPLADTSHIPTVLLCEIARKQVTVSLSGDAGDELFGGYEHYRRTQEIWEILRRIPLPQRARWGELVGKAAATGAQVLSQVGREPRLFKRMWRLSELLPATSDQILYETLISCCRNPGDWLAEPQTSGRNDRSAQWNLLPELLQRMMYWDFVRYLPDEILVKVDRAAMAVSLETRIPLLDHRIIEFAWSLPSKWRQKRGQGKWLLRQVLHQFVPPKLLERRKQGFAAPVEDWLRDELRPWAEELLSETALRQSGVFQPRVVRRKWLEHLCRRQDWGRPLWNVLMFQAWSKAQSGVTKPAASERAPSNGVGAKPAEVMAK